MDNLYGEHETTEWKVTWFPPDRAEARMITRDPILAERKADAVREWNPIIETRTIRVTDWRTAT